MTKILPYQKFIIACFAYFTFILFFPQYFVKKIPTLPETYQLKIISEPTQTAKGISFLAKTAGHTFLVYAPPSPLRYGDSFFTSVRPQALENKRNFLISTYDEKLKIQGISGKIFLKEPVEFQRPYFSLGRTIIDIRNKLSSIHEKNLSEKQAQTLNSFLFGTNAAPMEKETIEKYRRAGIIHLLVVSGSQIAILIGTIGGLTKVLRLPSLPSFFFVSLFNLAFTFATGGGPSIFRAFLMAELVLFAELIGKKNFVLGTLTFSALIATLFNPLVLFDIGFQLSYAATIALIYLAPQLEKIFGKKMPLALASLLSKSLAPLILTTPLVVYHFNQFSLTALPVNMLVLPWVEFLVLNGFAATIIGSLIPFIGFILDQANGFLLFILDIIVNFVDQPWTVITIKQLPIWFILSTYFVIWQRKFLLPYLLLFGLLLAWPKEPELNLLDVGQGDCILIEDGSSVMIDCGGEKNSGLTAKAFLQKKGISSLDLLIVTHEHSDHINGISELKANRIITSQNAIAFEIIPLKNSRLIILPRLDVPGNNGSIACLWEAKNFKALFAGDLEKEGEQNLLDILPDIDLLKVGHHGSNTSSSLEFLEKVKPEYSLISVGRNNRYKHPAESTIQRLERYGKVYRTDLNGGIKVYPISRTIQTVI